MAKYKAASFVYQLPGALKIERRIITKPGIQQLFHHIYKEKNNFG